MVPLVEYSIPNLECYPETITVSLWSCDTASEVTSSISEPRLVSKAALGK